MPKQWMRFGDAENMWNSNIDYLRLFYEKRYDYLIPLMEKRLG